jgi:hypothetical protein
MALSAQESGFGAPGLHSSIITCASLQRGIAYAAARN